jgi:hypothetical protein
VIFAIKAGLTPPAPASVTFNTPAGTVGSSLLIQGSHFIGTTAVKFNGVAASFNVLNTGNIQAVVPAGATSGPISVINAGGTASSHVNFIVN